MVNRTPAVAVASGKGGVGKTAVAVALARGLTLRGRRIGLIDADLTSPDVPRKLGLVRSRPATHVTLSNWAGEAGARLEALDVHGLQVASSGFLFAQTQGLTAGGDVEMLMLNRLINETQWNGVDAFVLDLPPGTGDVFTSVLRLLPDVVVVLVVTPDEFAHLDTGRALTALDSARVPVLGVIENMARFRCPDCSSSTDLFAATPEERSIWFRGVDRLDSIDFRPQCSPGPADIPITIDRVHDILAGAG